MTQLFYDTFYFWLILLLGAPMITMRLFAQEKNSGTFETLMTAPVTDIEVVLAKFTAAFLFYIVMWLPFLACLFVLRHYTSDRAALDWGAVGSSYLGITLMGALLISMGCFASSLTHSQSNAAVLAFCFGLGLFFLSFLALTPALAGSWAGAALSYLSLVEQMRDFAIGTVDSRYLIYYATATTLFLFLTLKAVESRRWKS